jgi:leucyl aminopeptidase (aminopeptidase T)
MFCEYIALGRGDQVLCVIEPSLRELGRFLEEVLDELSVSHQVVEAPQTFDQITRDYTFNVIVLFQRTSSLFSREVALGSANWRSYRVFDAVPELFSECFRVPKADVEELHGALITVLANAKEVRVTSSRGTDLSIRLSQTFGWLSSYGVWAGRTGVMPPSEVATYSPHVSGLLVADGAVNANIEFMRDPRLMDHPVVLEFESSKVVSFKCSDPIVHMSVSSFLSSPNGTRVGEVGFGTNVGLRRFVPFLSHINERFPGLHIGLGSHNQGERLDWSAPLHLDFILQRSHIVADGFTVMRDGQYQIEALKERARNFPKFTPAIVADTI